MIVCGIEIVGSKAVFTMLKEKNGNISDITGNFSQLQIKNDDNCDEIRSFAETIASHFDNMNPERISIIKRNKKGQFAGGATSFKLEGLIQLYSKINVELISPHTLRKYKNENSPQINPRYKYQEKSYLLAMYLLEN